MMTGRVMYDIPDAVEAGLADRRGVRARWDEVNAEVQKACWSSIEWGGAIGSYQYRDSAERGGAVVSALIAPSNLPPEILGFDAPLMVAVSALFVFFAATGLRIGRREGALLLAGYGAYAWSLWP